MAKYLIIIITGLLIGFVCSYWAKTKNRDPFQWFLIGFFLNFIGLAIFSMINSKIEKRKNNY